MASSANPWRIAVADLGTNSTRLLIAELSPGGELTDVERHTEVTRLGDNVDASGHLSNEAIERVHACLARYREHADAAGVEGAIAVATSAVRDADNGPDFQQQVRDRHGFDIRTISGEEEARLTFLGATAGRDSGTPTLVIDIGGGSTELIVGEPGQAPTFHVSMRLGSVRQTERHLHDDPPDRHQLRDLAAAARTIISEQVPAKLRGSTAIGIAVAGTATSLAAIDQELEPYDSSRVHGYRLPLGECKRMLARLAGEPLVRRRETPGLMPDRAPTIVAGVAILVEALRAFGLESVEISEADILRGAALDSLAA